MNPASLIRFDEIAPYVIGCKTFTQGMSYPAGHKLKPRLICNYEVEIIIDGSGLQRIGDQTYPSAKGSIFFKSPGSITQGTMPYNSIFIIFDIMSGNPDAWHRRYEIDTERECAPAYRFERLGHFPVCYRPENFSWFQMMFEKCCREGIADKAGSQLAQKALLLQILQRLYVLALDRQADSDTQDNYDAAIRKSLRFIETHFDQGINIDDMARQAGLSTSFFSKMFRRIMDKSPKQYLIAYRIAKAKEMLAGTTLPVQLIGERCGFDNPAHFTHTFKRFEGLCPAKFRNI